MSELNTGDVVDGRYKVLSRLGAGGMADVFLAEDLQLGRRVALKLLHRRFAEDPDFVERFRREAQAAAGLQHPHVVSVYDRGAYNGTYYIAMEYLPGRSLKQLIRQEAPLDPVRAIDIVVQILKAARFAHRRGVIHRDLKPHNVIVDDSGHAKVTDFGIARAGASDMTETGSIMGTAQYLSPEQAQGLPVDATSDLYSVGVVLYELLTGQVPFDAESAVTIALRHVSEPPPPPSEINPEIPPELEQATLWAMNKNPADRPRDADQFITVLERVKEAIVSGSRGQRTASMPVMSAGVLPLPPPPPPAAAEPEVPLAEPVPVAAGGEPTPPPEPKRQSRRRRWALLALLALILIGAGIAIYLLTKTSQVTVPKVIGESVDVAQAQIQNGNLTPNLQYRPSGAQVNTVILQNPLAGAREPSGTTVTLTISNGPGNVSVPSVAGLSESAAKRKLRRAHLKAAGSVQNESSTSVQAGDVTRTDPSSGTLVSPGSAVTLYVSSGRPQVSVPDVTNESEASAKANLARAGFTVSSSSQGSSSVAAGDVISQTPAGSSQAAPGSGVSIVVSTGPAQVPVPNVVGQSAGAAQSQLQAAGFTVSKQTANVTKRGQDGKVVSQSPASGSQPKGSTITITVGVLHSTTTTTTTNPKTTTTKTTPTNPTPTTTTSG